MDRCAKGMSFHSPTGDTEAEKSGLSSVSSRRRGRKKACFVKALKTRGGLGKGDSNHAWCRDVWAIFCGGGWGRHVVAQSGRKPKD